MLRLSFEKMIVAEIRTIRLYCYQSNCGEIIRKYFNNSAKEDGLGMVSLEELTQSYIFNIFSGILEFCLRTKNKPWNKIKGKL